MPGTLLIATAVLGFALIAQRLATTVVTAPMVFLAAGLALAQAGVWPEAADRHDLHLLAEVALVVLLFLDAAQTDTRAALRGRAWPARMLGIGMPLGFLLGVAWGALWLPGWPLAALALVAAVLLPTDAALGQPVLTNPDVPDRPRRALTVESGLNDGIALPLVLMMAALAAPASEAPPMGWAVFAALQIALGPLVGAAVGWAGGRALLWAKETGRSADVYEGIGTLALAAIAYLLAVEVGGNGFIAAFAAGLGFGLVMRGRCAFVFEFAESEGQLLSWAAFLMLGAVLVPDALAHLTWSGAALILGSLLIVRPLAIWIALAGSDASAETRLFFGWFGPRGLATALFALLVVEQIDPALGEPVLHLAVNAVWISALLHGITAAPGARWYAARLAKRGARAERQAIRHSAPGFARRLRRDAAARPVP